MLEIQYLCNFMGTTAHAGVQDFFEYFAFILKEGHRYPKETNKNSFLWTRYSTRGTNPKENFTA